MNIGEVLLFRMPSSAWDFRRRLSRTILRLDGLTSAVVERFPEHPVTSKAWVQLARLEFGEGDLESARDIYLAVLERYPEFDHSSSVYMELGIAYTRMGDSEAAAEAFESVGDSFRAMAGNPGRARSALHQCGRDWTGGRCFETGTGP